LKITDIKKIEKILPRKADLENFVLKALLVSNFSPKKFHKRNSNRIDLKRKKKLDEKLFGKQLETDC